MCLSPLLMVVFCLQVLPRFSPRRGSMCNYRDGGDVEDWDDDSDTDDHADDMGDDGHHEQGARDSDLDLDDEDRAFLVCPSVIFYCCAVAVGIKSTQDWFRCSSYYWVSTSSNIIPVMTRTASVGS